MWDTSEEEFELKNYFRDHQISMDMFTTNFYDITLLRRFGKMNKMTIPNKVLIGYGQEFQKYAEIGGVVTHYQFLDILGVRLWNSLHKHASKVECIDSVQDYSIRETIKFRQPLNS
jgi:hypothetical protein